MPTYEYECEECKHSFDIVQRMDDDKLKTCPKCQKDALIRLIGMGVLFSIKSGSNDLEMGDIGMDVTTTRGVKRINAK